MIDPLIESQIIEVRKTFNEWVFQSIESSYEATKNGNGTPLACFMLASSAIDALAGFYVGRNDFKSRSLGEDYKLFVERFMPDYDPKEVYIYIRCALTHNYTISGNLGLTHGHPELHDVKHKNPEINKTINFDDFFSAVREGANKYFTELNESDDLKFKFARRLRSLGFAHVIPLRVQTKETELLIE